MDFLLSAGTLVLVFVCLITVLVILMQRPSANAGMGAALGGGAAEQAFGGEAGNVLTKMTTWLIIAFFVLSFGLFLGFKGKHGVKTVKEDSVIRTLTAPAPESTPAAKPAVAPAPAPEQPAAK